jgi:hypothetical protein
MIALSPALLVAGASVLVGLGEEAAGSPGGAWDAAFVHHVGFWTHFDARMQSSSWPVPPCATAVELAAFAEAAGVLSEAPQPGDLFLLKGRGRTGFVKTGIVTECEEVTENPQFEFWYCVLTVEGDSSRLMQMGGGTALRHRRVLCPRHGDRFVRWADLDRRAVTARGYLVPPEEVRRARSAGAA